MAPPSPAPYVGPTSLTASRYASPQLRTRPTAAATASALVRPVTETTIATKEQIAMANSAIAADVQTSDTQLALDLAGSLKENVNSHVAKLSSTIATALANIHELLVLIRKVVPVAELQTVDELWSEVEKLFAAANDAKAALPMFLEKQRNNMSLYHSSQLNETLRQSQDELNLQYKKVNLQHNLILEQQQAFQDYKATNDVKLQEVTLLQERVSRLTLEKGNLRTEVEKFEHMLQKEASTKAAELNKAASMQKELEMLAASNNNLQSENNSLRAAKDEIATKLVAVERVVTERFTNELKLKTEEIGKANARIVTLNALVDNLKTGEATAKKEADKAKAEYKSMKNKYDQQSTEHAQAFMKQNEQAKKVESLVGDIGRLRQENSGLKDQLHKIDDLQGQVDSLSQSKSDLSQQVNLMTAKFNSAMNDATQAKHALADLSAKSKGTEQAEKAVELLKAENAKLKTQTNDLTAKVAADSSTVSSDDSKALEGKVKELEGVVANWKELAQKSYHEYKALLPSAKVADQLRQDALTKDAQINELKTKLASVKAAHPNGMGSEDDIKYWKNKYDQLLANCSR